MQLYTKQELEERFRLALRSEFPQFARIFGGDCPDSLMYRWTLAEGLHAFIVLQPNQYEGEDSFFVEIAVSDGDAVPYDVMTEPDGPYKGRARFRIADLWTESRPRDEWRTIDTRAFDKDLDKEDQIDELVIEVMDCIRARVIPYFTAFAARREKT